MKTAALIPARTGSKGIPGKNFKLFHGKPLWQWTFEAALESDVFDLIILSSDGGFDASDIHKFRNEFGVEILVDNNRPEEHCTDEAPLDPLMMYYKDKYKDIEMWCLLQVTSPLRDAGEIRQAFEMAKEDRYDSIVAVTPNPMMFWIDKAIGKGEQEYPLATYRIDMRPNRQDRKDYYMETGALYFTKTYVLAHTGSRLGGEIGLYVMSKEKSYEIDDPIDWAVAEKVMEVACGVA